MKFFAMWSKYIFDFLSSLIQCLFPKVTEKKLEVFGGQLLSEDDRRPFTLGAAILEYDERNFFFG